MGRSTNRQLRFSYTLPDHHFPYGKRRLALELEGWEKAGGASGFVLRVVWVRKGLVRAGERGREGTSIIFAYSSQPFAANG